MPHGATANSGPPARDELTRLADDLAATLRRGVEACWEALLDDPAQLGMLAERLASRAGPGPTAARASAEDFATVVDAIALLEHRLTEVEDRMRVLAEVTATVARAVERLAPRGAASGPGGTAVGDVAESAEP